MADPTKYTPAYSYSGWQATNPSRPLPAGKVDNDFANVSRSVNQTIDALKDVRRSDGKLKNQSVGPDQLSPALTIGFTFAGAWVDGRSYSAGDGVVHGSTFYSSKVAHTADVANAPGNAAYWNLLYSLDDIVVTGGMALPRDSFVGDGVTAAFSLSFVPLSKFNLFVQVGGVVQGTDDYSANGNTLTFVSPPPNGYDIEVRGFATTAALVTPEDASVTTAKLAGDVTAKLPELVPNTMPVDNAAGTAREAKTFAEVRSLLRLVYVLEADNTGATDVSAAFFSAVSAFAHVRLPAGTYLINGNGTVPPTCTVEFDRGAVFSVGPGRTVTWNGGIIAGPYQRIFSGDLVQSGFMSGVTPPYVFGVRGSPKCPWTSPYWFGAAGDGIWATDGVATAADATFTSASASFSAADIGKTIIVKGAGAAGVDLETTIASINSGTSVELAVTASTGVSQANYHFGTLDSDAIDCWLYFGNSLYLPAGDHFTSRDHGVKRSNVRIYGDGKASVLHGAKGTSALLGLSGVGVGIQSGIVVENVCLDAGDVAAYNALGLTYVKDCVARNIWTRNCGHYSITLQYECYNNLVDGVFVEDAATASGSTRAVVSLEGTDGVFTDVDGNTIRNVHAETSGANGVVVIHVKAVNTIENVLVDAITGDATTGVGVLLRLREEVEQCVFKNIKAGSITGLLIAADAEASNNTLEDIEAELITGSSGSSYGKIMNLFGSDNTLRRVRGYSSDADAADVVTISGARNKLFACYFKGDTTGAILRVSGTDNEFYGQETVGLSVATRVGNIDGARNKFIGGRTERPNNLQGLRFNGTDCSCDGMTITGDGAAALRVEAAALRPIVVNNHLAGALATIDKFFASASTGVICNNRGDTNAANNFMLLGPYALWVDAAGDLRINNGAPATDTSGAVVGTQT